MPARIFHGWVVVGAAFLVLFVAYGTQYSFGIFFSALLAEFGWSRGSLSGAFSLYTLSYSLVGAASGRLTDRWGPRTVIAFGGVFLGIALTGMALVTRLWQPYVLYGIVAALGMGTAYVPCNTTVVRWFVRRRGLAVGVAGSGGSVGSFVLPPLAQLLVGSIGWRAAYVLFGAAIFLVLNAVAPLMRRDPESMGLQPDGATSPVATACDDGGGWSLGQAAHTRGFWMLTATFTAHWVAVFIPLVHIVPFTRDLGYSPMIASSVLSVMGVGAVLGRVVMGGISDRLGRKGAVATSLALQVATFVMLARVQGLVGLCTATATFGYSYGALSALYPAIIGDFFGRARAGALVGAIFGIGGPFGAVGPLMAGTIYDATGSYVPAFVVAATLNAGALLALVLARAPVPMPATSATPSLRH